MKISQIITTGFIFVCLSACGEGALTNTITAVGNPTTVVTSGTETIQNIPALDLNAADSAQASLQNSLTLQSRIAPSGEGGENSIDILVTQTATAELNQSGDIAMFQCAQGVQDKYIDVVARQS